MKNCSNGEPGGNMGISGPAPGAPARACAAWVDEMLTTAGNSFCRQVREAVGSPPGKRRLDRRAGGERHGERHGEGQRGGAGGWAANQAHGRTFSGGLAAYGPARGGWQQDYCPSGTGSD